MNNFFSPDRRVHHMNFPFVSTPSTVRGRSSNASRYPAGRVVLYLPSEVGDMWWIFLPRMMSRISSRDLFNSGPSGMGITLLSYLKKSHVNMITYHNANLHRRDVEVGLSRGGGEKFNAELYGKWP